jgi:hypothetical protein
MKLVRSCVRLVTNKYGLVILTAFALCLVYSNEDNTFDLKNANKIPYL